VGEWEAAQWGGRELREACDVMGPIVLDGCTVFSGKSEVGEDVLFFRAQAVGRRQGAHHLITPFDTRGVDRFGKAAVRCFRQATVWRAFFEAYFRGEEQVIW